MTELNAEKVGFTRKSCTGFGVNSEGYIFWKKDSIVKLQKIDFTEYPKEELITYRPIELKTDFFFTLLEGKRYVLQKEKELKRFQVQVDDVQELDTVSTGYIRTSHSCYRNIYIKSKKFNYSKQFDYFNLAKSLGHSKTEININYEFNKKLKIVESDSLINKELEQIKSKNKFIIVD
ncbi:hypothetical protein GCM10009430_49240 [Aquimarina litoralis]|uniref:Uncharacterized protein n=2 Tax=Aquimarina litoralis TaxID=584605 RepID=A0ABN1JAZ7_9FLAO